MKNIKTSVTVTREIYKKRLSLAECPVCNIHEEFVAYEPPYVFYRVATRLNNWLVNSCDICLACFKTLGQRKFPRSWGNDLGTSLNYPIYKRYHYK